MARKERNNIDYFPHSVSHGKKMFYLRSKFKNDGYAVWFMLLEELGKADYHYLDLKDNIQLMYLSASLMVEEIVLRDIINILVDFGEFDKELWEENSILFNEKFIDNISDAYKKRNNECIDKDSLLVLLIAKGVRKPVKSIPKLPKNDSTEPVNPQRIVKDSKLEEIKEEETTEKLFVFKKALLKICNNKEVVKTFLEIRKKKKATNSEIAFNALKTEFEKTNKTPEECLTICCEKSWAGFKAEWVNNITPQKQDNPRKHEDGQTEYTSNIN